MTLFIQHNHPVRNREDARQLVADDDKSYFQAARQRQDQIVELRRGDRIESGRRLVEKQHLRVERHGAGDGGALLHAAAQFRRHVIVEAAKSDALQLQRGDHANRIGRQIGKFLQRQTDIVQNRHRAEQRAALIHDAEFS